MRLVGCPGRVELDGTNDPFDIASDEEDCLGVGCGNGPSPPVLSARERERREKTYGSPRLDRVYQKLSQRSEIGITHRRKQSLDHVFAWSSPANLVLSDRWPHTSCMTIRLPAPG